MYNKRVNKAVMAGLIFTIAAAVVNFTLTYFFSEPRLLYYRLDIGIDAMGAMVSAALYFGYMRQEGRGANYFRGMNLLVSLGFLCNELMYLTIDEPRFSVYCFIFCLICKLTDLAMVLCFYKYIRSAFDYKHKMIKYADKIVPILTIPQAILILSNIFYPVTFMFDEYGKYVEISTFEWTEDIFLLFIEIITIIVIIKSDNSRSMKFAAMLFIIFSLVQSIAVNIVGVGSFGNAGQYGMILIPLIVIYCIIFNSQSALLAATEAELNLATDIQTSMLPSIFPPFPTRKEFDLYASMDPAKEVGGDFYDFFMIDDDHLGIVIADVSGKGVPSALFMMSSKILIAEHATMGGTPADILARVNNSIIATGNTKMFVTVWLGVAELSTGKVITANGGHEYPMINVNGQYELYEDKHGIALGVLENAKYINHEFTLKKGDSIFVYTDGVAEATNADNVLFEEERVLDALNAMPKDASQEEVLKGVHMAVDEFVKTAPQHDDLTMIGFKYFGPEGK